MPLGNGIDGKILCQQKAWLFQVVIPNLEELGAGGNDPCKPGFVLISFYSSQNKNQT